MLTAGYANATLTSNGTVDGVVTVSGGIAPFKVGATCYLNNTTPLNVTVKVIAVLSTQTIQVQVVTNNVNQLNYGASDISAFTTATSSTITQPQQDLSSHDYAIVSYGLSASTGQVVPIPTT
jgi:hypothetical protein